VNVQRLTQFDSRYPARLRHRLGAAAPSALTALGNLDFLAQPMTALFCSARCPGDIILRAYDQAARWRDAGHCVISGFHSPVERECLAILLRGKSPIFICPARSLPKRIPTAWENLLAKGHLLILSPFQATENRVTADLAARRNEFVAALADEAYLAYATPGGHLEALAVRLRAWGVPAAAESSMP
jgi:predicted Rossmann fold nucleotide-binding protein DprA/Smf involved in DNA uptake